MSPSDIDYQAFILLMLRWFLLGFAGYVVLLILLRMSNYYKLSKCPNCSGDLKRSQRHGSDRLITTISFGILPIKRYRCYTCYWEGQALELRNINRRPDPEPENAED